MDNRYFDGIRRGNQNCSIPAFGLIGGANQPSTQALTEALKSPTVEFSIMSKDYDGMESAYHALPKRLANMMLGSGMAMGSGMRDHGFECKTEADMKAIVQIYKKTLGKTPMKVVRHSAESVESDASAAVTEDLSSGMFGEYRLEKANNPRRQRQGQGNKGSEAQYCLRVYRGGSPFGWIIPLMGTEGKPIGYSFHHGDPLGDQEGAFYAFSWGSMKKALDALKNKFLA